MAALPRSLFPLGLLAAALTAPSASAQTVAIWPGAAPGSEHWTQKETTYPKTPLGEVVINVVRPTLTAYLPPRGKATGTGVIIAPGGGFVALAMDLEARDLARWLQARGVAAFVLKYRTIEKLQPGIPRMDMDTAGRYAIADGLQALAVVRRHASEWRVAPDRVGIIGFSAGAMVASGALLEAPPAERPSFAAMIYGGPFGEMPKVASGLPPTFLAWAADDSIAAGTEGRLRDALVAAGNRPEVHVYTSGGHGFGTRKQGTDSDRWMADFGLWLAGLGTKPTSAAPTRTLRPSAALAAGPVFFPGAGRSADRHATLALGIDGTSLGGRLDAMYMGVTGADLLAVTVDLVWKIGNPRRGRVEPYLIAGLGGYFKFWDKRFGLNAGGGVRLPAGPVRLFAEMRYHGVTRRFDEAPEVNAFVPLSAGVMLGR